MLSFLFQIANAKLLYQELNKGKFHFENCWNILRLQPKWKEDSQKKKPIKKKYKSPTPMLDNQVNFEDDNIMSFDFVDILRPPGRKAEKDRKKRKGKDMENNSTGLCVNLLQEMREEKRQFNEKKLQLFEKAYV